MSNAAINLGVNHNGVLKMQMYMMYKCRYSSVINRNNVLILKFMNCMRGVNTPLQGE